MKKAIAFDPSFKNKGKGRRRGKVSVDTDAQNLTGSLTFYAPPSVPEGGYVIVSDGNTARGIAEGSAKPVFWTATDDDIAEIVTGLPGNTTPVFTAAEALDYLRDNDYFVLTSNSDEIVTDGLVLELDASKKNSFVDNEPLTNIARTDTWSSTWNNSGTAIWNSNDTTVPRLFPDVTVQSMLKTTNGNSHLGVGYITSGITEGVECTYSVFVYIPHSNSAGMSGAPPYMRPFPANYNATYLKYNGSTSWGSWPRGRWIRVEGTATPASNSNGGISTAYISSYLNTAGDKIYYTAPQFEVASKATAFTSGSRSQNTIWHDLSGNGYDASKNGNPTYNPNGWWEFRNENSDGDFEYFTLSFDEGVLKSDNTTGEWTLEALWRDMGSAYGNENIIIGRWGHHGGILQRTSGGYVYGQIRTNSGGTGQIFTGNTATTNEKWMHIVLTYNNRTARFYIDGKLVDTDSMSTSYTVYGHNNTMAIGGYPNNSYRAYADIAKVKAYNKELSQTEINQNYYGGPIVTDGLVFAIDAGNLVSYENGSTTTYSMTGSLSGTLNNGAGYSNLNGGTFVFDGTDDYISTEPFDMGTPTDITLECWIKFDGTLDSNDRKVMHYDKTGSTNAVFQLRKGTDNSRLMYQAHNGTTWYTMTDTDAIESDTWAHFIITHAGTSAVMYKNGIQAATATMGNLDWTNANNLLIGYRAASEYWKGNIAIMRIYDKKLSASEVGQNFEAQKARFGL